MRKNKKFTHLLSIMLLLMVAFTCIPVASGSIEASAAIKEMKGTVYSEVIKRGNTAYCAYNEDGDYTILKVDLNTGKKTRLVRNAFRMKGMKQRGSYLYYGVGFETPQFNLYRVNVKTGKKQKLARVYSVGSGYPAYVLGKTRIYYREAYWSKKTDFVASRNRKIKLNGTDKKRLYNTRIRVSNKRANVSGYKVIYKGVNYHYDSDFEDYVYDYYNCYLKKPDGSQIYLAKVDDYW